MASPTEPLTFEDLTEVYRREQRSKGISDVRKDFYPAMRECVEKLKHECERESAIDQFSAKAKSLNNQLTKVVEKASQIFGFRMEKILQMALRSAEGNRVDPVRLTIEEKEIFDKVSDLLRASRGYMLEGNRPRVTEEQEEEPPAAKPAMVEAAETEGEIFDATPAVPADAPAVIDAPPTVASPALIPPPVEVPTPMAPPIQVDYTVLKILEDIPAFAGPDHSYRLQKEDMVTLPPMIAKALIARKKAIDIQLMSHHA